jgi:two-component system, response regulator YesN
MKIVIADDEPLARVNIRAVLHEIDPTLQIVGEATNGLEVIALVAQTSPDMAFVDIRMPDMDGLEAIRSARKLSQQTKWVILTSFSEFEYAQDALRLGVVDYLVKPVDSDAVRHILQVCNEERERHLRVKNIGFEKDLTALFYGLSAMEQELDDSLFHTYKFWGAIYTIDSGLPEDKLAADQAEFTRALDAQITQLIPLGVQTALLFLPGGELATVVAWSPSNDQHVRKQVFATLSGIQDTVTQLSVDAVKFTMFTMSQTTSFVDAQAQLDDLRNLAMIRSVIGIGRAWDLHRLQLVMSLAQIEFGKVLIQLSEYYHEKKYAEYLKTVQSFDQKLLDRVNASDEKVNTAIAEFIRVTLSCELDPSHPSSWQATLEKHSECLLIGEDSDSRAHAIVAQACVMVEIEYMRDIKLSDIAEKLYLTPNYLSMLFKREKGVNFVEYLTCTRMIAAKELLSNPNVQVQQVAERVGYSGSRHFSRLFKAFTGLYPTEYREQFQR